MTASNASPGPGGGSRLPSRPVATTLRRLAPSTCAVTTTMPSSIANRIVSGSCEAMRRVPAGSATAGQAASNSSTWPSGDSGIGSANGLTVR